MMVFTMMNYNYTDDGSHYDGTTPALSHRDGTRLVLVVLDYNNNNNMDADFRRLFQNALTQLSIQNTENVVSITSHSSSNTSCAQKNGLLMLTI